MVVAEINTVTGGSTGKIMLDIARIARRNGIEVYTFSSRIYRKNMNIDYKSIENHFYYGSIMSSFLHKCFGRLLGLNGFFSIFSTISLVKKLKQLKVDTIHLHNIHDFCINLPILFRYITHNNISVIWTLHDCWTYTGHCPYYTVAKCNKWMYGCGRCPQKSVNPRTVLDTTHLMWKVKRHLFLGIDKLTIVTPSEWLSQEVSKSFLKDRTIKVIHNGIDLSIFRPQESDIRRKYNIMDKYVILGVASGWDPRKGIDVFITLADLLDPNIYKIILVGTDVNIDNDLPECIISIHRTNNQNELAQLYTLANVFVNPTREDNYPTVNMEAIACGTPVVTFNTGGSPEMIGDNTGCVLNNEDISSLISAIERIRKEDPYSREGCVQYARKFDKTICFNQYSKLYLSQPRK